MRLFAVATLICSFVFLSGCDLFKSKKTTLNSEEEKNLYFLGTKFGDGLSSLKLSEADAKMVTQGFQDAVLGQKIAGYDGGGRAEKVQEFLGTKKSSSKQDNEKQGREFLANFVSNGGQKTASGLAYQIVKEGEGTPPAPTDVVDIHYKASLADGTVYANTKSQNQPARYPLDKIVAGWSEGIQLIKPGGEIKLVIPAELAYGENGAPPNVPGGATIVMEVELITVTKLPEGN